MLDGPGAASFRTVLERSPAGARLRRRVGALGGCGIVLCVALAVVGAAALLLALGVMAVVAASAVATARRPRRRRSQRPARERVRETARTAAAALLVGARRLWGELLRLVTVARRRTAAAVRARKEARTSHTMGKPESAPAPATLRDALRLNATGVELRRRGEPERAAECHRAALSILEALGDRRGVALTQSNIALALERAGAEDEAVAYFEEAIWTLDELDDREREGQVIANLGAVHLRHGRPEEAQELFHAALEKLSPESALRGHVERQLARVT